MTYHYTATVAVIAWPTVVAVALFGLMAGLLWVLAAALLVIWRAA